MKYEVDRCLTGARYRRIIIEICSGCFDELEDFLADFEPLAELDYSDAFVHKVQTLLRLLIDLGEYDYVIDFLQLETIFATYESPENEGEECVYSYAIRKIDDDDALKEILETYNDGPNAAYLFEYAPPSVVATNLGRYDILKTLCEHELLVENTAYGRYTLLQYAIVASKYDLAYFVVEELGHSPDTKGVSEVPPIALAACKDDFIMAEYLIEKGADINALDSEGHNAFFYCVSNEMRELLLSNGGLE